MNLNQRSLSIMRYLLNYSSPISSEVLASILGVTSKTIRLEIDTIDLVLQNVGAKVNSKPGSGYMIEVDDFNEFSIFLDSFNEKYGQNISRPVYNEESIKYIIHYLLIHEDYVKSDVFIEKLFISRTTLTLYLKYVRNILKEYHLSLEHKPNYGLKIIGQEQHIRLALVDYLFLDEDISLIEDTNPQLTLDIKGCMDAVKYILVKTNIHISFLSLKEFASLISISDYRYTRGCCIEFNEIQLDELMHLDEYDIVHCIYSELNIVVSKHEIAYLALFLASRRVDEIGKNFSLIENKSLFFLCDEILRFIFIYTDINFLMDEKIRLLLAKELRGLQLRVNYGIEYKKLPLLELKKKLSFDYAMLAADYLNKKYGYHICEQEIAQLSMIFQYSLIGKNIFYPKQRVCLVLYKGYLSSCNINFSLKRNLSSYIESISSCEYYELKQDIDKHYDLIITDMPRVNFNCTIPVYHFLNQITNEDIHEIKKIMKHQQEEFDLFVQAFHDDLIFTDLNFTNKNDVITFLSKKICEQYSVSNALTQAVKAKETLSSSEMGNNVAIVHSLFPVCEKTTIAVGILKKPIVWDNEIVQLVFFIALSNNEKYVFMSINLIKSIICNIFAVHELLGIKDVASCKDVFDRYLAVEDIE